MKGYSVLGISLMDFSAREGLRRAERFLQTGALNTTSYINAQSLAAASRDEQIKQYLEEMGSDLLSGTGYSGSGGHRFSGQGAGDRGPGVLREFLKRLGRQRDKVYLIGDTVKQAEALREMLLKVQENLNIAGARGYEEFERAAGAADERIKRSRRR